MKISGVIVLGFMVAVFGWALQHAVAVEGQSNTLKIGDVAPDFSLPNVNAADSNNVSLSSLKGKIVVLCFDSKNCPVAAAYHDRMNQFYDFTQWADAPRKFGIVFLAINANETESPKEIKSAAESYGAKYPILKDAGSKVADLYGAVCTPHVFIVNPQGKLSYMGAFDDAQKPQKVSKHYVMDAVNALLDDKKIATTETVAFGCAIQRP